MPSFQTAALIAATFFCLLVLSFPSMAQQPATNVAVGPGIVSANLMGLVTHPAVQKELKMTYEQKSQLKRLSTKEEEQRLQWFQRMGISRTERAGYLGANTSRKGDDQLDATEGSRQRQGGQAALTAGESRSSGNSEGVGSGTGFNDPLDMKQQNPFLAMLESRQAIDQATERSIARILSQAQYARARQIQLQVQGPAALFRSDIRERLFLDEDQVTLLRELMLEQQNTLRELQYARRLLREAALARSHTPPIQPTIRNEFRRSPSRVQ